MRQKNPHETARWPFRRKWSGMSSDACCMIGLLVVVVFMLTARAAFDIRFADPQLMSNLPAYYEQR